MEQTTQQQFCIEWRDAGKWPKIAPNPAYPEGIDLNVAEASVNSCICLLPYPAKRIGAYIIECKICGYSAACTTAGRPDDPRSIKVPCKLLVAV